MSTLDVLRLGRVGLFLGVETFNWGTGDWSTCIRFCQQHKVDFVIVKVFDAGNEWYGGNFAPIYQLFRSNMIQVMPYGFMGTAGGLNYDLDRDLPNELPLVAKYMSLYGMCCGDMEGDGWSGRPDLGQMVANYLSGKPGTFTGSTPANPVDANMVVSFQPMDRVVSMWMPMAYNNYLASVYKSQYSFTQFTKLAPTFDMTADFGPDDLLGMTKAAGTSQVSYWEYQTAVQNAALFDQCVQAIKGVPPVITPEIKTSIDENWNSFVVSINQLRTATGEPPLPSVPTGTGIYAAYSTLYMEGKQLGGAKGEYTGHDWSGHEIQCENFDGGRIEYYVKPGPNQPSGSWHAYGPYGQIA